MTYHHNLSKKQKTRHSNNSSNSSSSSDRDDRSLDHSLIGESLNLSQKNVAQIAFALTNGTQEVRDLLLNECNIIYECRLCKNMFRSFANLVAHKRIYCKDHQCEQMMLYEPSWFVPEQETNDVKVEVTPEEEPIQNPKISFLPKLDSKTLELKRKSLHSIANSLQKDTQSDDSDTKPISTLQFYSNEKQKETKNSEKTQKDETLNVTKSQQLTRKFLNKQTDSLVHTSVEESTLNAQIKAETSNQNYSGETILSTKNSTKDIITNPTILNKSSPMTRDHKDVEILNVSANENSSSKATTSVIPTPIVCRKNKHRPNRNSILKLESPNSQKNPKLSEMKPQTLKTVKPIWSGNSNAYGSLLNRHYHNNHHQSILSKESSLLASSSPPYSSSSSSMVNNSNVHECSEQVCTKMQTKSDEHNNQCNDNHERPAHKLRIPIEVITIDSDNDDAYSDEIYAL